MWRERRSADDLLMDTPEPAGSTTAPEPGRPLPPPQPPAWRPLRARHHVLAGVCQGLAVATGVDVTLVRLAFIAFGLTGVGVLAYVALALVLPVEDPAAGRPLLPAPADTARWLRVALLVVPILSLLGLVGGWRGPFGFGLWPAKGAGFGLLLVAVGVLVIWLRRRNDRLDVEPPPSSSPAPVAGWEPPLAGAATAADRPDTAVDTSIAPVAPPPAVRSSTPLSLTLARVFAWLAVMAAVVAGAVTIWLERIHALSFPKPVLLLAAGILAIGLVVAVVIVARTALPVVASTSVLLVPVVLLLAFGSWHGGVGDRFFAPPTLAATQDYRLAIGRLTLDLSRAPLDGRDVTVTATDKVGVLEVLLPADAAADVRAHVGAGESRIFGHSHGGLNVTDHTVDTPPSATSTVHLDLDVAVGGLNVCRMPSATVPLADGCAGVVARA
jgi:phage shock protein PspC (stress-responsive transcriptional regulator)